MPDLQEPHAAVTCRSLQRLICTMRSVARVFITTTGELYRRWEIIYLQKMEIDGKRLELISGGIEGSSREVSANRSRISGSRPKTLIVKKWGVQKCPGSNFRWSPGRPQKVITGRSPSLKTESEWLPPVASNWLPPVAMRRP